LRWFNYWKWFSSNIFLKLIPNFLYSMHICNHTCPFIIYNWVNINIMINYLFYYRFSTVDLLNSLIRWQSDIYKNIIIYLKFKSWNCFLKTRYIIIICYFKSNWIHTLIMFSNFKFIYLQIKHLQIVLFHCHTLAGWLF